MASIINNVQVEAPRGQAENIHALSIVLNRQHGCRKPMHECTECDLVCSLAGMTKQQMREDAQ